VEVGVVMGVGNGVVRTVGIGVGVGVCVGVDVDVDVDGVEDVTVMFGIDVVEGVSGCVGSISMTTGSSGSYTNFS
jgi:hypothetical protein